MKNLKAKSDFALIDSFLRENSKESRYRRTPLSASLIDRSNSLLKTHRVLFKKTVSQIGESDTYFKQTLRNYCDFDLPILPLNKKSNKKTTEKKKNNQQLGQGDYNKNKVLASANVQVIEDKSEEDEAFYSPISNLDAQSTTAMAAEEEQEDMFKEDEQFANETEQELDEMEGELDDSKDDKAILKEVEECEAQCMEIYKILNELKKRVGELLNKSERTPEEDKELETKQHMLNDKMALLEQKTRRIELLVGKTKRVDFDKSYDEDTLPKVVVCGFGENNMPKFIICDDKKRKSPSRKPACSPITGMADTCPANTAKSQSCSPCSLGHPESAGGMRMPPQQQLQHFNMPPPVLNVMPQFARKLSESYNMQERLAQENADLEGKRYKLQEDLLTKDQTVESLQRQLSSLQNELRMVVKENGLLNSKLQKNQVCPASPRMASPYASPSPPSSPYPPCGPNPPCAPPSPPPPPAPCACGPCPPCQSGDKAEKRTCGKQKCPFEMEKNETKKLEKQLTEMEAEVRAIQNELSTVRQERLHLEQHRRMLTPMAPPGPVPAVLAPPRPDNTLQMKELREQYNTLQDDYKSKLTEVSGLRADIDKFKTTAQELQDAKKASDDKIKELERQLRDLRPDGKGVTKETLIELEQQLAVAKQRFREAQDEMEEIRALTEEQQGQVSEYRNKYLEAQQQVEEQKRQIDLMELENNRIGEQVNLEIQRVKNQFQEKLQELTPLPDILKATQLKLQEAQQMHLMAERNNEALLREVQVLRDKAVLYQDEMNRHKSDQVNGDAEKQSISERNEELEVTILHLTEENENLRELVEQLQEKADEAEKRANEKLHEIAQLNAEVENVREEAARQVARTKDRCETVRRSMQVQIADLEKQLAQSRACAKSAQKDRDDIRQKMQMQINNLNENFEDAQMRIRTLQGHVNFLKSSAALCPTP